jgi:hypothetical protein
MMLFELFVQRRAAEVAAFFMEQLLVAYVTELCSKILGACKEL